MFNARSLCNKLPDLHHLLYNDNFDVICVTESWLNHKFPSSLLDPLHKYNIQRTDRVESKGGGVCVFIAKRLNYAEFNVSAKVPNNGFDIVIFDILNRKLKYRFFVVYRRPTNVVNDATISAQLLILLLNKYHNNNGPNFILGDLNCPEINWALNSTSASKNVESLIHSYIQFNGFTQCINDPTRQNNILDVLCVDEPLLVRDASVEPPFSDSDHNAVHFNIQMPIPDDDNCNVNADSVDKTYLWAHANYAEMSTFLGNVNWNNIFTTNFSPDDIWYAFTNILNEAIDLSVPSKSVARRQFTTRRHYPRNIRLLFNRKRAVWRLYKADRLNQYTKVIYKKLSAECRLAVRRYELSLEDKVINSNNIGKFYRFVNSRMSCRSGVGTLINDAGEHTTADKDKSNILNEYFCSVCTKDNGITPPFDVDLPFDTSISNIQFDSLKLITAINKLKKKNSLSCGPDGYPVHLLIALAPALVGPLSQIYNSFISVGKMPAAWKEAIITPVFKKGSSQDPSNYRPISQTSVFCKLMERVIATDIADYLSHNNLLSSQQHGFLAKRSTLTNLLETTNDWSIAIDNKKLQTAIYVDFSRAFDSVSHEKLIKKLSSYGIRGELLSIIKDFLIDRSQRTRVGNELSNKHWLTSGVVQGSCLGPLLFLLYINDIFELFGPPVVSMLYADDLKLYSIIESQHDADQIQRCLDSLNEWSIAWQLQISINKCQTLDVGSQNRLRNSNTSCRFHIGSEDIVATDSVSDLGVLIDGCMKFSKHISNIVHKAATRCHLIMKCFLSKDTSTLMKAFKTYVRPLLEYNSSVWSPHLLRDINSIERVQRRFTKRLRGMHGLSYDERLTKLHLERLEARRIRIDIINVYKIIFGLTKIHCDNFFTLSNGTIKTRGHDYKLIPPSCSCDTRLFCYAVRVVNVWNNLPALTTNFASIRSFKMSLSDSYFNALCKGER